MFRLSLHAARRGSSLLLSANRSGTHWSRYFDPPLGKSASTEPPKQIYPEAGNESLPERKARLMFKCSQREQTGELLSSFAEFRLEKMPDEEVQQFDQILGLECNDKDMYDWLIALKPAPPQLASIPLFQQLLQFIASGAMLPQYKKRPDNEPVEIKRQRLLYQSRKRGMLENGLLLSCFAARYLETLNEQQLATYDELINEPSNDWDIYYWVTGAEPTPPKYDTDVLQMLKEFVQNEGSESRIRQPDLP